MVAWVFFGTMLCKGTKLQTGHMGALLISRTACKCFRWYEEEARNVPPFIIEIGKYPFHCISPLALDSQPMQADPIRSPDDRRHNTFLHFLTLFYAASSRNMSVKMRIAPTAIAPPDIIAPSSSR